MKMQTHEAAKAASTPTSTILPQHSGLLPLRESEEADCSLLPSEDWVRSPSSPTQPPINPSVGHSFGSMAIGSTTTPVLQRMAITGNGIVQRQANPEDEQKEEEPIQAKVIARSSQHAMEEMQALYGNRAEDQRLASQPRLQAKPMFGGLSGEIQTPKKEEKKEPYRQEKRNRTNQTGIPDDLKAGVENLSGYSLDDVRVHYDSPKPVSLQAYAYTQGTDIHVAPGQEEHLPHEVWHVVQQKQARVKPQVQRKDLWFNTESALEREADEMGRRATKPFLPLNNKEPRTSRVVETKVIQGIWRVNYKDPPMVHIKGIESVLKENAQNSGVTSWWTSLDRRPEEHHVTLGEYTNDYGAFHYTHSGLHAWYQYTNMGEVKSIGKQMGYSGDESQNQATQTGNDLYTRIQVNEMEEKKERKLRAMAANSRWQKGSIGRLLGQALQKPDKEKGKTKEERGYHPYKRGPH
jgi:hypothetical protein